tara:strand:+ start:461 stop:1108 length:648 start_codon:yes stop_codon:yes gene_type:complete
MLLTLDNNNYFIPEKWTEVSLGSYQKLMKASESETDEHTKTLNMISALTGAPFELLEKCKKQDIDKVVECISKLLDVKVNATLNTQINIDDVDYGFHPNLKDMTMAEFVDLDNNLQDVWKNLHKTMAILYRPITKSKGKKYAIEEYDSTKCMKNAEIFKDRLSIATVNGASGFFLTIATEYLNILRLSLNQKQKKMMKDIEIQNSNLEKSGVGME